MHAAIVGQLTERPLHSTERCQVVQVEFAYYFGDHFRYLGSFFASSAEFIPANSELRARGPRARTLVS